MPDKKKPAAEKKPAAAMNAVSTRTPWLDAKSDTPLLETYARRLDSFIETMADGKVEDSEIKAQETRLQKLMKELEPKLEDDVHEQVTALLCEMTAYNLMQMIHTMQQNRPKTVWRG